MEFFDSLQTQDKEFYQYLVKPDVLGTIVELYEILLEERLEDPVQYTKQFLANSCFRRQCAKQESEYESLKYRI